MTEFSIYGKDGLFHNIVKKSEVMDGRYFILNSGHDLNLNNLLASIELPKENYPCVCCLPPASDSDGFGAMETVQFRLLFLTKSNVTGDNQFKDPDADTNTSLHTTPEDWSDMKAICMGFMRALEKAQMKILKTFQLKQGTSWRILRISNMNNVDVNGVMIVFSARIDVDCMYEDIAIDDIDVNSLINHQPHQH